MDYAMNRPWWAMMDDEGGPRGRHHHDRDRDRRRDRRRSADGEEGFSEAFGPDGFFGPRGFFGPGGPFGPSGPFGPDGVFGPGRGRGPGRRGARARRGDVRSAILALLAEEPMNGYQVIQVLEERTGGLWKPSPGAVYPALAQLTDEGLVEQVSEHGRQAYRLTDAGRTAASELTEKPWEAVQESAQQWIPDGAPALWKEFGQVAAAAKAVLGAGDPDLTEQATAALRDTRRRLYGLLAEVPDERDVDGERGAHEQY